MNTTHRLACTALLSFAAAAAAWADSVASSASSAGSASLGSLSESIGGSSDSSSAKKQVADGDYRVIDVAALVDRPGMLRLTLQAVESRDAGAVAFTLDLPQQALGRRNLATGDDVSVRQRPYGLEFAYAGDRPGTVAREAFFLVLADDWQREIDARAVRL